MGPFDNNPMQTYAGWGVNPAYMTPSYLANFRPAYAGGDPYNPYARGDSILQSAWTWGPGDIPYGADPLREFGAAQYNMTTGLGDAAAWGAQNIGLPVATWMAANRINNMSMWNYGAGRTPAFMGKHSLASRLSSGLATRAAGRLGLGFAAGGIGTAAGLAGHIALPFLAASAMASGANAAFMDPYVSTRRGMDSLMANTTNSFVQGRGGAESGGFGMSATRAFQISKAITEAGQRDFSLSGMDYQEVGDMMMRGGMFAEIGDLDTDRIVEGVKQGVDVLKLISRITGDPDIRNGVDTLAKLKMGGLDDIRQMGLALQQIRNASASSGISVNQLMDTIGNQGMVMAQQHGMRGVTGLLASADAFAGFTAARRAGVISGAQMQALGGAEGMTQNAMSAAMTMMSSPYGRMIMQGGGQFGTGLTGAIGMWGAGFSGNPMASMGDWFMNRGAYMDQALGQNGPEQMVLKSLQAMARASGQNANDGRILAAMAQNLGLSPEQFRSIAELDRANKDPRSRLFQGEASNTASRSDYAALMQQEGLGWGGVPLFGNLQLGYRQAKSAILGASSNVMAPVARATAAITDAWDTQIARAKGLALDYEQTQLVDLGGQKSYMTLQSVEDILMTNQRNGEDEVMGTRETDTHRDLIASINRLKSNLNLPAEARNKLDKAYGAVLRGDGKEFGRLLKEVDEETKGALSGSEFEFVREDFILKAIDAVNAGEIRVNVEGKHEGRKIDKTKVALHRALREGDYATLVGMIKSEEVSWDDVKNITGTSGTRLDAVKAAHEKLMSKTYTDIDLDDRNSLYNVLTDFGVTEDELQTYRNTIGVADDSALLREYRSDFMGIGKASLTAEKASELSKKIKAASQAKNKLQEASNVDWTGMKDIGKGIGLLGQATETNTQALNTLTRALNDNTRSRGGAVSTEVIDYGDGLYQSVIKPTKEGG